MEPGPGPASTVASSSGRDVAVQGDVGPAGEGQSQSHACGLTAGLWGHLLPPTAFWWDRFVLGRICSSSFHLSIFLLSAGPLINNPTVPPRHLSFPQQSTHPCGMITKVIPMDGALGKEDTKSSLSAFAGADASWSSESLLSGTQCWTRFQGHPSSLRGKFLTIKNCPGCMRLGGL